jgi:hypothetical protein
MEWWFSVNKGGQRNTFQHAELTNAPNVNNSATTGEDVTAHRNVASAQKHTTTHKPIFVRPATAALGVTTNLQSVPTAQEGTGPIPLNVRFSKQFATKLTKPWMSVEYVAPTQQQPQNPNHTPQLQRITNHHANRPTRGELRVHYNHGESKNQTKCFAKTFSHWPKPLFFSFTPSFQRERSHSHHFYKVFPWQ